jgi:nanoRNase/pAp phosphatase (c-di-AMP/oligoRNAs hydrolase)
MDHPFAKAISSGERYERLLHVVRSEDTVGVIISADPDAMASALTLKRLFWRKVKNTKIYYINAIKRSGNLAFTRLLNIDMRYVKHLRRSEITKLAIVDSQPHHSEGFKGYAFDIIIDHHPMDAVLNAPFIDIKPDYGATSTILTEYLRAAKNKTFAQTRNCSALRYQDRYAQFRPRIVAQ